MSLEVTLQGPRVHAQTSRIRCWSQQTSGSGFLKQGDQAILTTEAKKRGEISSNKMLLSDLTSSSQEAIEMTVQEETILTVPK